MYSFCLALKLSCLFLDALSSVVGFGCIFVTKLSFVTCFPQTFMSVSCLNFVAPLLIISDFISSSAPSVVVYSKMPASVFLMDSFIVVLSTLSSAVVVISLLSSVVVAPWPSEVIVVVP